MKLFELIEKIADLQKMANSHARDFTEMKKDWEDFSKSDWDDFRDEIRDSIKEMKTYWHMADLIESEKLLSILDDIKYILENTEAKALVHGK